MNTFLKYLSGSAAVFCALTAIWDMIVGNYGLALIMVGCVFININTFRSCCKNKTI